MNDAIHQPRLYVALDSSDLRKIKEKARMINDIQGDFGYKINLDAIVLNGGVMVISAIRELFGRQVFADLKMWNGGRTMSELAVGVAEAGASLTNVYAHTGVEFMRRVQAAIREAGHEMDVFGLGVLTHYTDSDCQLLYRRNLSDSVRHFAEEVALAGLDGYIQPGTCLDRTSAMTFKKLVPAIRPDWFEDTRANSQEQTVTPEAAFGNGADIIVAGSPIFKSPNPAESLYWLLQAA
jgi:orotidine 5'-phosphate decarboxylase subfamily 1